MELKNLKINKINNLISLAIFGSYGTQYWREGYSDIDVLVIMEKREDIMDEIELEEELIPILREYFKYYNIHLTFINMKEFDSIFARQYLECEDKLIVDEFKEIDFRLYINKYRRNNQWLEDLIKRDIKERSDINDSIL